MHMCVPVCAFVCECTSVYVHTGMRIQIEVIEQLAGVGSLLQCGSQGSNSGCWTWCRHLYPVSHLKGLQQVILL